MVVPSPKELSLSCRRPSFNHLVDYGIDRLLVVPSLRAKRSNPWQPRGEMDCFVASLLAMTTPGPRSQCRSRPQRLQDQIDHMPTPGAFHGRAAQIRAEDGRQRRRVGEEEIAQPRDRNIEVHGVDAAPEGSLAHALFENLVDHADER